MKASIAAAIITFAAAVAAGPAKSSPMNFFSLTKRASLPIPASKGTETLKAAMEVTDFDGGMKTYGRGVSCTGQAEGGDSDAVFIVKDGDATISGGGATGAEDKVIQHNGAGTVTIDGFTVDTFGKLYRSCGNCKQSAERHVVIKGVKASNGKLLAGINSNFGDTATIDSSTCASSVKVICEEFEGTTPGNEPKSVSTGPSKACAFTDPIKSC